MTQYNMRESRKGFSLLELLVVVGVVALLTTAGMVIINPSEQLQKSRDAERKQDLRQLQVALDAYNTDNNRYPAASGEQISVASWGSEWSPYMAKVPKDPLSTQSYLYQSDGQSYRLYAKLERCPDPQTIPQTKAECDAEPDYNYSVVSSNRSQIAFSLSLLTPTPIPPPPFPTPTSTPTPTPSSKYVFATSGNYNGDLETQGGGTGLDPGLDGADKICESLADNSTIPSVRGLTWAAWLSTSSVNAKDRIPNAEYRLVDGTTVVATSKTDLITDDGDGNYLKKPINKDENNGSVSFFAWTGTTSSGTFSGNSCSDWKSPSFSDLGMAGVVVAKQDQWTAESSAACTDVKRLYCFEQ